MSADLSVRKPSAASQRAADALLRSLGGGQVALQLPVAGTGDGSQLGVTAASFQSCVLSPAVLRRVRGGMEAGGQTRWELLLSASAVQERVSELQLASADALFAMASSLRIEDKSFLMEAVSTSEAFGQVYLFRVLMKEAQAQVQ